CRFEPQLGQSRLLCPWARHFTCCLLVPLCLVLFPLSDQTTITAESGQNVTLPCRAPNNNIIVVKWNRTDLGDEYVLYYRDEQFDPENQHPSFKNRVDLLDGQMNQMKDGDVSLILNNVTINDTGTYKCHVVQGSESPADPNFSKISKFGLSACAVLLVAAVIGFLIYKKREKKRVRIHIRIQLNCSLFETYQLDFFFYSSGFFKVIVFVCIGFTLFPYLYVEYPEVYNSKKEKLSNMKLE
uniref:Ig-like domain-containing protein n=1 Tax=Haplochromis burtoni TaxID=8153 RepID=A0A3Q2WAJ7_HAPBU